MNDGDSFPLSPDEVRMIQEARAKANVGQLKSISYQGFVAVMACFKEDLNGVWLRHFERTKRIFFKNSEATSAESGAHGQESEARKELQSAQGSEVT